MSKRLRSESLAHGLLFFVVAVALWPLLRHPFEVPFSHSSDLIRHYLPFKYVLFHGFQQNGHLPRWDPHTQGGHPILEDPGYGAWYPLGILFWVLPPQKLFSFYIIVHTLLAAFLARAFCRRFGLSLTASLIGGFAYSFNLKLVVTRYAGFMTMIAAQAWLPGAFLGLLILKRAVRRRDFLKGACLLGGALGMQVLAGDAQLMVYTFLGLVFFALFVPPEAERVPGLGSRALLGLGLGGCLALVLAWPTVSGGQTLAQASVRASGVPYAISTLMSVPPSHLPAFFFPAFSGSDSDFTWRGPSSFWEVMFYPGLALWILAFASLGRYRSDRRILPLMLMGWLSLLFSFGRYTPLYTLFYYVMPYIDRFRGPARVLPVLALIIALLGAMEIDALRRKKERRRRLAGVFWITAGGAFALFGYLHWKAPEIIPTLQSHLKAMIVPATGGERALMRMKWDALIVGMTMALGGYALYGKVNAPRKSFGLPFDKALFVLVVVDLLFAGRGLVDTMPLETLLPPHSLARALEEERKAQAPDPPARVLDLAGAIPDVVAVYHGLHALQGMNPLVLLRPYLFARYIEGASPEIPKDRSIYGLIIPEVKHPSLLDLLRIEDIVQTSSETPVGFTLKNTYQNVHVFQQFRGMALYPKLYHYQRKIDLPYAWRVDHVEIMEGDAKAYLQRLEQIDPYSVAMVEPRDKALFPSTMLVEAFEKKRSSDESTRGFPQESSEHTSSPLGGFDESTGGFPQESSRRPSFQPVSVESYHPDRIEVSLSPQPRPGLLILSEVHAQGWRAEVDGRASPVICVDFLLRGVLLPSGSRRVVLRYGGDSFF